MTERGLTQSELARRVGVKQPSIGRLLSGQTRSTSVLVEIARELGTTPGYLTGEIDHPQAGSAQPELSDDEAQLLEKLRSLSPDDRRLVMSLTKKLAGR